MLREIGTCKGFCKSYVVNVAIRKPDDFIATGIKELLGSLSKNLLKLLILKLIGKAKKKEKKDCKKTGDKIVEINERYYRPSEVDLLIGDPSKAKEKLNWNPEITFDEMINEMVNHDIKKAGI